MSHLLDSSLLLHYLNIKFNRIIKRTLKVSETYLSNISLGEDQMSHDQQPGDYTYWKRHNLKDFLLPGCKDSYQALLTSSCTGKLKGVDSWISFHSQRAPALDWSIERVADFKITLKQCSSRGEITLTPGQEEHDNRRKQFAQDPQLETYDHL